VIRDVMESLESLEILWELNTPLVAFEPDHFFLTGAFCSGPRIWIMFHLFMI